MSFINRARDTSAARARAGCSYAQFACLLTACVSLCTQEMSAAKIGAALATGAGLMFVAMQFQDKAEAQQIKGGRLKKTLSNGGLWPEPEKGGKLKSRPSGEMALFTQGASVADVVLAKEGGKAL
mgnify:CR=1 FL=1